ncbi:MAG: SDR family oxidoreductase [Chloroflexi bacterium]|nr:SDR family oxidoreductase [Chloroflexota bacterium]
MKLAEKVAIITGGGGGIGRATGLLFAQEGARVVIADLARASGEETVRQIEANGGVAMFVETDVTRPGDVAKMVSEAIEAYGRLDILFNNAGILGETASVGDATEENWDRVLAINLRSVFLCSKYAVREMLKSGGGAIINTSSATGLRGLPGNTAYNTSKAAVIAFTRNMALEYAANNIRVNCICPGHVATPMTNAQPEAFVKWFMRQTPMGRQGRPEEIARAALYLASDDSSYVTGTALVIDGGWVSR